MLNWGGGGGMESYDRGGWAPQSQGTMDLGQMLSSAVNRSRMPPPFPEPVVFGSAEPDLSAFGIAPGYNRPGLLAPPMGSLDRINPAEQGFGSGRMSLLSQPPRSFSPGPRNESWRGSESWRSFSSETKFRSSKQSSSRPSSTHSSDRSPHDRRQQTKHKRSRWERESKSRERTEHNREERKSQEKTEQPKEKEKPEEEDTKETETPAEEEIKKEIVEEEEQSKSSTSRAAWELKIETLLGLEEGPEPLEEVAPPEGIEETPLMERMKLELSQSLEEKPSRSRPGLVFKGQCHMRVSLPKFKKRDFKKFYVPEEYRKITVNPPSICLRRLSPETVARHLPFLYELKKPAKPRPKPCPKSLRKRVTETKPRLLRKEDRLLALVEKRRQRDAREDLFAADDEEEVELETPLTMRKPHREPEQLPPDLKFLPFQALPKFKIQKKTEQCKEERGKKTLLGRSPKRRRSPSPPRKTESWRTRMQEPWKESPSRERKALLGIPSQTGSGMSRRRTALMETPTTHRSTTDYISPLQRNQNLAAPRVEDHYRRAFRPALLDRRTANQPEKEKDPGGLYDLSPPSPNSFTGRIGPRTPPEEPRIPTGRVIDPLDFVERLSDDEAAEFPEKDIQEAEQFLANQRLQARKPGLLDAPAKEVEAVRDEKKLMDLKAAADLAEKRLRERIAEDEERKRKLKEKEEQKKKREDDYDMAAAYVLAGAQDQDDREGEFKASVPKPVPPPDPQQNRPVPQDMEKTALISAAVVLMDKLGLSWEAVLRKLGDEGLDLAVELKKRCPEKFADWKAGESAITAPIAGQGLLGNAPQKRSPSPMDLDTDDSDPQEPGSSRKSGLLNAPFPQKKPLLAETPLMEAIHGLLPTPNPLVLAPPPPPPPEPKREAILATPMPVPPPFRPLLPTPDLAPMMGVSDCLRNILGESSSSARPRMPILPLPRRNQLANEVGSTGTVGRMFTDFSQEIRTAFFDQPARVPRPVRPPIQSYTPSQLRSVVKLLMEDRGSSLHRDPSKFAKAIKLLPVLAKLEEVEAQCPGAVDYEVLNPIIDFVMGAVADSG